MDKLTVAIRLLVGFAVYVQEVEGHTIDVDSLMELAEDHLPEAFAEEGFKETLFMYLQRNADVIYDWEE